MHHTTALQVTSEPAAVAVQMPPLPTELLWALEPAEHLPSSARPRRGRPLEVSWPHLWLGLLSCVLQGMHSYQDFWRLLCSEPIGDFAPVQVSDDALVKRLLQAGLEPLQQILTLLSQRLSQRLGPIVTTTLAPFASEIVALDETTLDAVARHLSWLRELPVGDPRLLAGKLAGRFNIRSQQWDCVQFRSNVLANCKVEVLCLLEGLAAGSLLLFDLGYFSFAWLDYLTQQHYWWVSRLREKTRYHIAHTYYRHQEILDALVWLGSEHGPRAGHLVRLVRFGDGHEIRCYLTNVLDPRQLAMGDIARLYARRWDIELAILTLKEQLGMRHWWSGKLLLIWQQIYVMLIVAQLLQALRLETAAHAGVDPFDVSLPLLVKYVPRLIQQRHDPIAWLLTYGRHLGFIRPSSRLQVAAPEVAVALLTFPPPDLPLTRKARYVEYKPRPDRGSKKKCGTPTSPATQPPQVIQLILPLI